MMFVIDRRINWDRSQQIITPEEVVTPQAGPAVIIPPTASNPQATVAQVQAPKRNGNGHASKKTRDLTDGERDSIWISFAQANGCVEYKDCSDWLALDIVPPDITIWQVMGRVSVCHRLVAEGQKILPDMIAYGAWMRNRYGELWSQFNNPLFGEVRATNERARASGVQASRYVPYHQAPLLSQFNKPQFKAFKKGYYK